MAEEKVVVEGQDPSVNRWSGYMLEAYAYRRTPILGSVAIKKVEEMAREKMKDRMGKS